MRYLKFRILSAMLMAIFFSASAFSQSAKSEKPSTDRIYDVVERMPVFPGGQSALKKYLEDNVVYPESARGEEGRVIVSFVVEKDGTVSNAKVRRSVHPDLDKEAERVVGSMPKWRPGRHNGEAVRVKYNVPITFRSPYNF